MGIGAILAALGPSLIAAGSQLFGSVNRARTARTNTMRTIRARKELAKYEFAQNKEMWREMMKYNTPVAQMSRFEKAGLNPRLIYGQGTPGNVSSFPQYRAPDVSYQFEAVDPGPAAIAGINAYSGLRQTESSVALQAQQKVVQQWAGAIKRSSYMIQGPDRQKAASLVAALRRGQDGVAMSTKFARKQVDAWIDQAEMTSVKRMYQGLMNEYQKIENSFARKGMSVGDQIQWRALISLINMIGERLGAAPIDFSVPTVN